MTLETCLCFRAGGSCIAVPVEREIIELLASRVQRGAGRGAITQFCLFFF